MKNSLKFFKLTTLVLLLVVLLEILFAKKIFNNFCPTTNTNSTQQAKLSAETKVEKSFELTAKKYTKDKFKISVIKAEKVKIVTTKNQPISAKENEEFLLLRLEIENNQEYPIVMDNRNYFRLLKDDKKLAPDFYNGEIQVDAISTKKDTIGFIIDESEKEFKLQMGEIDGTKEIIEFKF